MAENIKEIFNKYWPKAKEELSKILNQTQKMLKEGEKHLKEFSEKSARNARKLSLSVLREKLYYDLGKLTSGISKNKWLENKKIEEIIKKIKRLGAEIKKLG